MPPSIGYNVDSVQPCEDFFKSTVLPLWSIALVLGCLIPTSLAQDPEKEVTAVPIQSPIFIDGNLHEPEWSLAQPATDFIQQEPLMGEPSTERTEVRILYDDENLYLGVYCFDSAGSEGITVTDISRDYGPRDSDTFTMVFDTFHDKRNSLYLWDQRRRSETGRSNGRG